MTEMEQYSGFAGLTQATDLLDKMTHDLERMRTEPNDPYPALDFLLTAEHVGEWPPGSKYRHRRASKVERYHAGNELLLKVCQLVNGAKHHTPTQLDAEPIERVASMNVSLLTLGVGHDELRTVNVDAPSDGLIELAGWVLDFWREEPRATKGVAQPNE